MTKTGAGVLHIRNLSVSFQSGHELVRAVNTVNLTVKPGEILGGLIGETGCGKTVLGMAILRLLHPDTLISGEIVYNGTNLLALGEEEMRQIRGGGGGIGMVLQNSVTSLNPVVTIGRQIAESVELHQGCTGDAARSEAVRLLKEVGISDPETGGYDAYPHEFSGGA
ncbi:ATP-binding cassette domain-containing protein [Methanogenium cariaci]|uniref:ATP-binding cassette domain-containing protein n=1 Tax=Methanogenium cariaci TaxID=2197 RepID=UPI001FE05D45|nr:ATP-binding cassette domain-containing protein [Methanogenium cariaci]